MLVCHSGRHIALLSHPVSSECLRDRPAPRGCRCPAAARRRSTVELMPPRKAKAEAPAAKPARSSKRVAAAPAAAEAPPAKRAAKTRTAPAKGKAKPAEPAKAAAAPATSGKVLVIEAW